MKNSKNRATEWLWAWLPFILIFLSEDYLKKTKRFFVKNSNGSLTAARPGLYVFYFKDNHPNPETTILRPIATQTTTPGDNIELEFKGLGDNTLGGWTEKLIKFTISKLWFKLATFTDPKITKDFHYDLERQAIRLQSGEIYPGLSVDGTMWNNAMVEALNHFSREGKLTKVNNDLFTSSITENGEYVQVTPQNLFTYLQKYHSKSLLWRILGGGEPAKVDENTSNKNTQSTQQTEVVVKPPLADGW